MRSAVVATAMRSTVVAAAMRSTVVATAMGSTVVATGVVAAGAGKVERAEVRHLRHVRHVRAPVLAVRPGVRSGVAALSRMVGRVAVPFARVAAAMMLMLPRCTMMPLARVARVGPVAAARRPVVRPTVVTAEGATDMGHASGHVVAVSPRRDAKGSRPRLTVIAVAAVVLVVELFVPRLVVGLERKVASWKMRQLRQLGCEKMRVVRVRMVRGVRRVVVAYLKQVVASYDLRARSRE